MFDTLTIEIFNVIRNSEILGRGSCSSVDECYDDQELKQEIFEDLTENVYRDVETALAWFERIENIRNERENEYSEPDAGADDDYRSEMADDAYRAELLNERSFEDTAEHSFEDYADRY